MFRIYQRLTQTLYKRTLLWNSASTSVCPRHLYAGCLVHLSTASVKRLLDIIPRVNSVFVKRSVTELPTSMGKKKNKNQNVPPSFISVQVVGTGDGSTPRSCIVHMDHFSYLFNCGEGTQRLLSDLKINVSKTQNIFITHTSWENVGGLLGMFLTLKGMGSDNVSLHGPPLVDSIVTSTRVFGEMYFKIGDIHTGCRTYTDSAMKIEMIPIYSEQSSLKRGSKTDVGPTKRLRTSSPEAEDAASTSTPKRTKSIISDFVKSSVEPSNLEPDSLIEKSAKYPEKERNMSIAYILQPHPKPRSVCLEKCVEVGITAGPLVGKLKAGESVILDDGKEIQPDDILLPQKNTRPVIVVECPDESYLPSLKESQITERFGKDASETEKAKLVIHLSSQAIIDNPAYKEWMSQYSEDIQHLIINEKVPNFAMMGVCKQQSYLNMLNSAIYPLLPIQTKEFSIPLEEGNVQYGVSGMKYLHRGSTELTFDNDGCPELDRESLVKEMLETNGVREEVEKLKASVGDALITEPVKYPEILFLGTGSALPGLVRNVSSIWVNLSPEKSVLLDCGEGTLGQIHRYFGDRATEMMKRLSAVFISHLHADHHMGLPAVLLERHKYNLKPLLLVASGQIKHWYRVLDHHIPIAHTLKIVSMESIRYSIPNMHTDFGVVKDTLGLSDLRVVRVNHSMYPFGVILYHNDGWSLAYSGDTLPCRPFAEAGKGVDILIHEATHADELVDLAQTKKHSTFGQAIDCGKKMDAKFTLLTHFSQRYAKVPILNELFDNEKVGIANDNMIVHQGNLHLLPKFVAPLRKMFAPEIEEMIAKVTGKSKDGMYLD